MTDVVIHARDLRKVYRLYTKPHYRFLDIFGLLGQKPNAYSEHAALDGVSLDIRRGEKVAIIGRNGAGKSTLLKLVTRVVEPTSGALQVAGQVHALLQIGTGFHPDFSGRQNVYAYLAQLGVTGQEADDRLTEIIEFAELEEYIDQPVKTYSTGMGVRLMFSTATAISPELLVLDEVLGVGDAYFSQKSYQRMRQLTSADRTTLLLVTHDVYSALKICERLIWIDRGRILMDGDGPTIVKAYEESIRLQEEERLRSRKLQRRAETKAEPGHARALLELQARQNRPQPVPVYVSAMALEVNGQVYRLPIESGAFDDAQGSHLQQEPGCWGESQVWEGRPSRVFQNHGSPFHKVVGVVQFATPVADAALEAATLHVSYWSAEPCQVLARVYVGQRPLDFGDLPPSSGEWVDHVVSPMASEASAADVISGTGVHGSGAIVVEDIELVDRDGQVVHVATHGEPVSIRVTFRVQDPRLNERPQVVISMHRDGVLGACRFVARSLHIDGTRMRRGVVTLALDRLMLGLGTYSISVFFAAEGYLDREQVVFYSMNKEVYAALAHIMEFKVVGKGLTPTNTVFVGEGRWTIAADPGGEQR